ncbi:MULTISPECIES: cutinase family protein [Actinomycetes]|uniref:cutinase family protein n=1 Tax=Actinomycetes TaxID=1760 RepID=UPI0018CC4072|nr:MULTISPECIES: cutinase family protein [Actinomycetes]
MQLTTAAPAQAIEPGIDCSADVFFVGARGSGQTYSVDTLGLGAQVHSAFKQVQTRLSGEKPASRAAVLPVDYPALPVDSIGTEPADYFAGLQLGVTRTLDTLRTWAARPDCRHQDVILSGYSQGAMVMHRVLRQLTDGTFGDVPNRVAGALLIADGDKLDSDNVAVLGSAPKNSHGIGSEFTLVSGTRKDKLPPPWSSKRVFSICTKGDAVCGATNVSSTVLFAQGGGDIHGRSYIDDKYVAEAVKKLQISYSPKVDLATTRINGISGTSTSQQVAAGVGPGCRFTWKAKSKWPAWARITESGLVSIYPPTAYSGSVQATVTSTCDARRSSTTTVTLRLEVNAPGAAPTDVRQIARWKYGPGDITTTANGSVYVVKCCKPRQVTSLTRDGAKETKLSFPLFQKGDGTARIDAADLGGIVVATQRMTKDANKLPTIPNVDVELLAPGAKKPATLPTVPNMNLYSIGIDNDQNVYVSGTLDYRVQADPLFPTPLVLRWQQGHNTWENVTEDFGIYSGAGVKLDAQPNGDVYFKQDGALEVKKGDWTSLVSGTDDVDEFTVLSDGSVIFTKTAGNYGRWYVPAGASEATELETALTGDPYQLAATPDGFIYFVTHLPGDESGVIRVPPTYYR